LPQTTNKKVSFEKAASYKTQSNSFLSNFNKRKEREIKRREIGKMYSESFKSKVNLSKNEDEASRENSRDLKKNVYLREIERKRKYLEKIEKNKELPD
jgi:hypothetical protein